MTDEQSIIVLFSYEYTNLPAVESILSSHVPAKLLIASKLGLGHTLLKFPGKLKVESIPWRPSYSSSQLETKIDRAIIFWDGSPNQHKAGETDFLESIKFFNSRHIPFRIFGQDAKEVAYPKFYATFQNGDSMSSKPQVIVDPPKPVESYGKPASDDTRVRLQIYLPESTVKEYEAQAQLANITLEKVISDRLRSCVTHTAGRGLYFNGEQRSLLERITGGHLIMDTETALAKIRTVLNLKVGDITIELNERILARCASRARSERKTLVAYVTKEVIQGLERSTGLRPW